MSKQLRAWICSSKEVLLVLALPTVIVEESLAETTWISTKSLDLLVKRGAVGTGVFDGHLGRTACEDNVNFNEELGLARQSQERKKIPAVSNPEAAGSSSTE